MLKVLPFLAPHSSRPGVELREADFASVGAGRVPFAGGQFCLQPGATSRPDTHDVSECWMLARGRGVLNYAGTDYAVKAGDYLFFEPRHTHFIHNDGDEELVIFTVWWLENA